MNGTNDFSTGKLFPMILKYSIPAAISLLIMFANPILKIFGVTETAYGYVFEHYRIVTLGCLFQGLTQVLCDFVRVSGSQFWGCASPASARPGRL